MTAVGQRAFAVWWKDLPVWSPRAFVGSGWEWPSEYIHPLGSALRRRNEEVKRSGLSLEGLQLITIRFSGDVQPREVSAAGIFKGRLFTAHAGDVVYSKIDVRNGAIGVVPAKYASRGREQRVSCLPGAPRRSRSRVHHTFISHCSLPWDH